MSNESQQVQLNACGWFLEEEKKAEQALNFLRNLLGTFQTERNTTYAFVDGYLAGIRKMYRITEER